MDTITSLQNTKVKLVHALQNRAKSRRKEAKIALEGTRLIRDAIERGYVPEFVLFLEAPDNASVELVASLQNSGFEAAPVTDEIMRHISDTQQPQGIIAVFPLPHPPLPRTLERVLILDAVRDPGNVGTILRAAAAANIQAVFLSPDCVDAYNPKTLRGGMGAHFRIPVIEASWSSIAKHCDGLAVYLAAGDGDTRYDAADWSLAWALIVGSEAHGAGDNADQLAHHRIFIPLAADTESLNAAMAASVILFEAQRQAPK